MACAQGPSGNFRAARGRRVQFSWWRPLIARATWRPSRQGARSSCADWLAGWLARPSVRPFARLQLSANSSRPLGRLLRAATIHQSWPRCRPARLCHNNAGPHLSINAQSDWRRRCLRSAGRPARPTDCERETGLPRLVGWLAGIGKQSEPLLFHSASLPCLAWCCLLLAADTNRRASALRTECTLQHSICYSPAAALIFLPLAPQS